MQHENLNRTTIGLLSMLIVFLASSSILAQQHREPKHPQPKQDSHALPNASNSGSDRANYTVRVRAWNPECRRHGTICPGTALFFVKSLRPTTDPAPFPLHGKKAKPDLLQAEVEIEELAKAINGTESMEPGLTLEGRTLSTSTIGVRIKNSWGSLAIRRAGIISPEIRKVIADRGNEQVYVPLKDVATALGAILIFDQAGREFIITIDKKCTDCLLEFVPVSSPDH